MSQDCVKGLSIVILAAGKGKRMKSDLPKVLHNIAGKPLLERVLNTAFLMRPEKTVVVVGHMGQRVIDQFSPFPVEFVKQLEQLGTGHAVSQAEPILGDYNGSVMILSGDVPLIRKETLETLFRFHLKKGHTLSLFSADVPDPTGYGRIVRDSSGQVLEIIEEKDASAEVKLKKEINTGIYCVKAPYLFDALKRVGNNNEQKEYYLTDIVKAAVHAGLKPGAVKVDCSDEIRGINTKEELLEMEKRLTGGAACRVL